MCLLGDLEFERQRCREEIPDTGKGTEFEIMSGVHGNGRKTTMNIRVR